MPRKNYILNNGKKKMNVPNVFNPKDNEVTKRLLDDFMSIAIYQAQKGIYEGGMPIGSVLVQDGKIIGRGHNRRLQKNNPILHAEIDCLQDAGRIKDYTGTALYSTLMPCLMCAGAIVQFKIPMVVVGESVTFSGAKAFLKEKGVSVIDLDDKFCKDMMATFIKKNPEIWNEDIGKA